MEELYEHEFKKYDNENAYGKIVGETTKTGADVYAGLANAHMSFDGIARLQAVSGDIVMRGRNGQRDILFPLEKATAKYNDWMAMTYSYAKQGIAGWTEMMDIAKEFKARIEEAISQRKKMGRKAPADALKLCGISQDEPDK